MRSTHKEQHKKVQPDAALSRCGPVVLERLLQNDRELSKALRSAACRSWWMTGDGAVQEPADVRMSSSLGAVVHKRINCRKAHDTFSWIDISAQAIPCMQYLSPAVREHVAFAPRKQSPSL